MALKHGTEAITEHELENALTTYLRTLNKSAADGAIPPRQVMSQWHGADTFVQWLRGVYSVPTADKKSRSAANPKLVIQTGSSGPAAPPPGE
jgi:hypothetical protein